MLRDGWSVASPLRINVSLAAGDFAAAVVLVNARRILAALGERPAALDGRGMTRRQDLARLIASAWWGPRGEPDADLLAARSEQEALPVALLLAALESIGAVRRDSGRLSRTAVGLEYEADCRAGCLYRSLFAAYFRDVDRPLLDGEVAAPVSWSGIPHALWVLSGLDEEWIGTAALLSLLLPAPLYADDNAAAVFRSRGRAGPIPTAQELLLLRFLNPLQDFALLDGRPGSAGAAGALPEWRLGRLFNRVISFEG